MAIKARHIFALSLTMESLPHSLFASLSLTIEWETVAHPPAGSTQDAHDETDFIIVLRATMIRAADIH
jgi:hypothetical protein